MSEKQAKISLISNISSNADKIEIWTETFVVRGNLLKEKTVDGIVSVVNAEIYPIFNECECSEGSIERPWLNIFEDKIISFTILKSE